uniref:Integrase catalytic domain-containing protein n=1 Tax=Tanacetum cinerariifolium TaxID=118510 RepID=A0A6L2M8H3_TANCI|nr:hypothetical protein [Tanacetum cinerariifolium]
MRKGSDIGIQEKKAKLFNEWEMFTLTDGESIESYYHRFLKLMNDLKRNKHFPKKIASNLKFLNNLQPEWSRHVIIVHQTKDLHTADYTQLYDFLKYNQKDNVGNQNGLIVVPGNANQNPNGNGNLVAARAEGNAIGHNGNQIRCYNYRGLGHFARNCTVRPRRRDAAYLQTQLLIAQKEEAEIQLQAKEFDLMAAAVDLDEIEKVNASCILMSNLQQASTSGTQTNKAPIYDSDGSAEVHNHEDCYDNEIFNMFTQEEQYTELLEPIPEPHQVPQNDNNVISEVSSVEQSRGTVEQHPANVEETHVLYDSLYNNLAIEVEKVNTINALHLSFGKQIMTLNEEIPYLNKQFSVEKSTVSSLFEEKKKLKSDFKIHEDELFDKQIQIKINIKELDNILVKRGQSIQTIHMLSPNPDLFYHTKQKMALGYQNPFYLKQAQQKQQSLYDRKVLFEKHDPPVVHDSEETLQLAQESRQKMKQLNKEIKPENYTKINHLSRVSVSQMAKSCEELYFSNTSKTANVSKPISIPNEEFLDDNTPSVARKFINKVKSTIVNLQQAAKFVGDFKSLAKEADESLAKHKALELEIKHLLRAVVSQDIVFVVQNNSIDETSYLQTELERFGDLQWGNILITRVYFVEGLGHNLFLVGQFCDSDLEVAFRRNTCFIRSLEGVDLLKGNHTTNLYTINLHEIASASPICLMARASSTKSWLWHQRKSKRASHPPKPVPNSRHRLHLLHMDLCGPMRIASINGKRIDNGIEFKNQVLKEYFNSVGISHQVSSVRTPQQNGVVERKNRTLVEAARTMLIFSRAPLFLWAEAIATAYFTQNRSIIHRRFNKTPYELINRRKLDISFLHVFGALCYPKNDREDIRKLGEKGELDLLFEAMYDDYIGGQSLTAPRTVSAAQAHQVHQTPTRSTSIADTATTPTNSSSQATNFSKSSQDVDGLNSQQQHTQQQGNKASIQPKIVVDNVLNAMFDANTFVNPFATPSTSAAESSSSQYMDLSNMHTFYQPYPHEF